MDNILYFGKLMEGEYEMPSILPSEMKLEEVNVALDNKYPGDKVMKVLRTEQTEKAFLALCEGRSEMLQARKFMIGIVEETAPGAYQALRAAAHSISREIQNTERSGYGQPVKFKMPNGLNVVFTQLTFGRKKENDKSLYEHCALIHIDDYLMLIDSLSKFKSMASEVPNKRMSSAPSYEKVTSGNFWDKVKQVVKNPAGEIMMPHMSPAEAKKFFSLRKLGRIKFDQSGRAVKVETITEGLVLSFKDYLSLGS